MHVDYVIEGSFPVPEGTEPLPGKLNQFRLPSGEIVSVYPVIEMASGPDADDHRDLSYAEAAEYGIALELYDRSCELVPDD
jgi:hypothetical protein